LLEHAGRLGDQVATWILAGVKAGPAGNAGCGGYVMATQAHPVAAQATESGEEGQEGIVILQGRVEAEDLIQLYYSWGKVCLAWRHSHLVDKNE
jgi:hypothetical protein